MAPFEVIFLSALLTGATALPAGSSNAHGDPSSGDPSSSAYAYNTGASSKFPPADAWLSFDELWQINHPTILSNNGGDSYVEHYIKTAILQVSQETNVDPRLILAAVMQDSKGNASAPCAEGSSKCGLLQASDTGLDSSSDPATQLSILRMIRDGVGYSSSGGDIADYSAIMTSQSVESQIYRSRSPKGGSLENLSQMEESYIIDITNRLLGWDGNQ